MATPLPSVTTGDIQASVDLTQKTSQTAGGQSFGGVVFSPIPTKEKISTLNMVILAAAALGIVFLLKRKGA